VVGVRAKNSQGRAGKFVRTLLSALTGGIRLFIPVPVLKLREFGVPIDVLWNADS